MNSLLIDIDILKFLYVFRDKEITHLGINKIHNKKQLFGRYWIGKSLEKSIDKRAKKWVYTNLEKIS